MTETQWVQFSVTSLISRKFFSMSLNMIVHIFSELSSHPCLTAVLNLTIQLGQLILWVPPPQAGTAHAVRRVGQTGKHNFGCNAYEGSKACHARRAKQQFTHIVLVYRKKREISFEFCVENLSVPDHLVSNACYAHHHGM